MSPVDRNVIEAKKALIFRELQLLTSLEGQAISNQSDLSKQHVLCHSVQILVSAVVDIAQHIAAEKGNRMPSSYAEAIEMLGEVDVLRPSFAKAFSEIAKLRNVLVHAYSDLDVGHIASLVPRIINDSQSFLLALDSAPL